jgi:hypothetical protein
MVGQILKLTPLTPFQSNLDPIHGNVHNAIGGDMATAHSPTDPLFFLHHANVDRLWAQWEQGPNDADPPNAGSSLKPRGSIITGKINSVLNIQRLGYSYA